MNADDLRNELLAIGDDMAELLLEAARNGLAWNSEIAKVRRLVKLWDRTRELLKIAEVEVPHA